MFSDNSEHIKSEVLKSMIDFSYDQQSSDEWLNNFLLLVDEQNVYDFT